MNMEAYAQPNFEVEFKNESGTPTSLPLPDASSGLLRLLHGRGSCRKYEDREMPAETLSKLLGAYGLTRQNRLESGISFFSRAVPSAGGLYPLELYVMTRRVTGVPNGIHHFEAATHSLSLMQPYPSQAKLHELFLSQYFLENANVVVMISAVFARTLKKYGTRGYRYMLFEAGHVAQTLCLLAAEEQLGTLCVGGFWDGRLNRFLRFETGKQAVIYCAGAGFPAQP